MALKTDDQLFHVALYDWLIEKNRTDILLSVCIAVYFNSFVGFILLLFIYLVVIVKAEFFKQGFDYLFKTLNCTSWYCMCFITVPFPVCVVFILIK